ncbi:hypothetical protein OIE66_36865 [Nonomuraea sp. NBC_01738]|uniref:hypothetical protein n=1 Tax=Nonomuraea sp. NBC_01738 TaxID=2976003 RepID=UPI002E14A50B|nr:hypothetical protein OIE66_36865 [Nonomuraea sp. NBC_01738]
MPSPFLLPLHTLRLAGKSALPLVTWFAGGEVVRFGLLYAGTEVSYGDFRQVRLVLSIICLTLVVMASMTVVVGMLHSLRSAMWEMGVRQEREQFWRALDRIAPAFAVIYLTWGFHVEDARDFVQMDWMHNVDQFMSESFAGQKSVVGRSLVDLDWRVSLVAMVIAIVLRLVFSKLVEKGSGKASGLAAGFSEFAVVFFGLNATLVLANARSDWIEHRSVVSGSNEIVSDAAGKVPALESFWAWVGDAWPYVLDALALPLTWLTIAVLVYGAFADDARTLLKGTKLERGVDKLEGSHDLTQKSFERVTGGFTERWVPLANSFRLTIKGGLALFGMFCLCYVVVNAGAEYALRGVRTLIGTESPWSWMVVGYPVDFVKKLIVTCLSMALLAATFDIAATRARARGEEISA